MTLPKGWTRAKLSDFTVDRVEQGEPEASPVTYIDIGSIDRDQKRVGATDKVSAASAPTRARQWVQAGDVLVALTRPNLNAVAMVTHELDGAVASTGFDVLRSTGVIAEWIFNRVRSQAFVSDVCKTVQGVVYPAIRPADVRRHDLPIPPAQEQRRIVDAIDSYLTRLDDAVASLERVQAKLKAYRASVLKAAVEGRLVPTEASMARAEKRDYEPADVLLARILKERRLRWEEAELAKLRAAGKTPKDDKWKANYEEPVALDTSTLPELPEGWCWASADALTEAKRSITYGVVKLGDTTEGGVPTLRSSNVRHLWIDSEYVKPISPQIANQYRRTFLEGGEVLVTVRGTLGGVAVVPHSARGWNISREVAILALVEPKLGCLVAAFIASPLLQAWMMRRTRGNTYTGINIESLKELPIPIPPLVEADRIVDQVEAILSVAEVARDAVVRDVHRGGRLRQSILKWAFAGKLVDQDPNDEAGDRLLARIRADRAAVALTKKTRGRKAKGAA